jgi:hypothetical protein
MSCRSKRNQDHDKWPCFQVICSDSVLKGLSIFQLTYLLTELSPSREAANCAATQELPSILRNPGSSPCSQEPSTGPYPEPDRSSPYHPILSI